MNLGGVIPSNSLSSYQQLRIPCIHGTLLWAHPQIENSMVCILMLHWRSLGSRQIHNFLNLWFGVWIFSTVYGKFFFNYDERVYPFSRMFYLFLIHLVWQDHVSWHENHLINVSELSWVNVLQAHSFPLVWTCMILLEMFLDHWRHLHIPPVSSLW